MEHIFILPYYCESEVRIFLDIADIWEELTSSDVAYSFLLCSRFDCPPSEELKKRFSKIGPTVAFQSTTVGKGIGKPDPGYEVEGPSAMFWDAIDFVNSNYKKDGGFAFWFEADMVPLKSDWVAQLHQEWLQDDHDILGVLIDQQWGKKFHPGGAFNDNSHMNGGACYRKDFITKIDLDEIDMQKSWDFVLSDHLLNNKLNCKHTNLIEFYYHRQHLDVQLGDNCVLLHGVKDDSARNYVRESLTSG